jgi:aminocarboxymuconate-semialdehyde decarboxylase
MLKIDIHTHILPPSWPDLRERYGYGGFLQLEHREPACAHLTIDGRMFRAVGENQWSAEVRLADCDRTGVGAQVLSTIPALFSYWAKPADGLDLCRMLNDHIAGVTADHPARFVGLGTVPL